MISIKDLVSYRMRHERIVNEVYSTHLDTQFGQLEVKVFNQITTGDTHLAVIRGNIKTMSRYWCGYTPLWEQAICWLTCWMTTAR